MTLKELRKNLNDPNLHINYTTVSKLIEEDFPKIETTYKIFTDKKLPFYESTSSYIISQELIEKKGFKDFNEYFINFDFKSHYEDINKHIFDYYQYKKKNNVLQELKDKFNDQKLSLNYTIKVEIPKDKKSMFPIILINYKIKTKVKLLKKVGTVIYTVTKDAMEKEGFYDINSYLLLSDKKHMIDKMIESISGHYDYCKENNII
jgi:hypothetical protein